MVGNQLTVADNAGASQPAEVTKMMVATRESIENAFSKLDLNTVTFTNDGILSVNQAEEAVAAVNSKLRELVKGETIDMPAHFGALLLRAGVVNTSPYTVYRHFYSYTVGGKSFTVQDGDIFPYILSVVKKYNKPNGLRAFFSTFENAYVILAKQRPELMETKVSTRRGTPKGYAHCSADFIKGSSPYLSDQERAMVNSASNYALSFAADKKVSRGLVSLYDYGKY
nr:CPd [Carrot closterovirus 2]